MKILAIQSGIFGDNSNSTKLVAQIATQMKQLHPDAELTHRDLTAQPLPYFDAEMAMALSTPAAEQTEAQVALANLSSQLVDEVKNADILIIGVPMYNFGIPAQLKSWIDLICRAGLTFNYTATGPVGLLADRPVYIAAARGGMHEGKPSDSQTPFIKTVLGFLGLHDVRIVYAEGLAMGDDAKTESLQRFTKNLTALV